jgi:predicted nucleic acid-binding protein
VIFVDTNVLVYATARSAVPRELCRRYSFGGRQVHDANVVATILAHGELRLLTFNEADFRRFAGLIEVVTP